jgi:FAD/FMN-containing dehydrogenase
MVWRCSLPVGQAASRVSFLSSWWATRDTSAARGRAWGRKVSLTFQVRLGDPLHTASGWTRKTVIPVPALAENGWKVQRASRELSRLFIVLRWVFGTGALCCRD